MQSPCKSSTSSHAKKNLCMCRSFAEDGSDDDEDEQGGAPACAVDIEVPAYDDSKAWTWEDLWDGNIVKAETKFAAADILNVRPQPQVGKRNMSSLVIAR